MKKVFKKIASAALMTCLSASALAAEYNWRYAIEEVPGSVQDLYAQEFSKRLAENSDGKIDLAIYPIGQLGNAKQLFELVQAGAIEFANLSPGNTGGMVPENQIFSLQFFFSDDMDVNKRLTRESKALDVLSSVYKQKNIKVMAYWPEGFQMWTSNKALNTPEDFKGFKMRVMPSPMLVAGYKAYGANPTPMPFMEVYSGLQLKMIDGQENPLFAIQEMNYMEVQDYLTLSKHGVYFTTTATNPMFFDGLPADIQKILTNTIDEMQDYAFDMQNDLNTKRLNIIRDNLSEGVEIRELTQENRKAFRAMAKKSQGVYLKQTRNSKEAQKILKTMEEEILKLEADRG